MAALERRTELPRISESPQGWQIEYGKGNIHPVLPNMGDVELRLREMDEQGIDVAMLIAKNTNPQVWNSDIPKVTNPGSGHVIVHDFAEGKQVILAGKPITYIGATGPVSFDRYQNFAGPVRGRQRGRGDPQDLHRG